MNLALTALKSWRHRQDSSFQGKSRITNDSKLSPDFALFFLSIFCAADFY